MLGQPALARTRAATTFACERIPRNVKSVFIQPTIALCKQSYMDARTRFPALKGSIRTIISRRGLEDKIAHRITRYLNDRDEAGDLLYVTHAGFLRTPHWHRADTWNLVVDEAMEVAYHREFRLRKYRDLLLDLFHVRPSRHERYGALAARNHVQLDEALVQMKDDEIYMHFADFIWRLRHDHWNLYVDREAIQKFESGETHTLEVHGLLAPSIFEPFASVTILGANLNDSIMCKYFAKEGYTFSDHTAINKALRYQSHNNGSRLLIKYLTDGKWSKSLRNRKIHSDDDPDVANDICGAYMDLCQQEAAKHSKLPPLWIGNNDIRGDEFEGERLKNVPHGMNGYKKHDVCCIFSALNPPQAHRKFLQDLCGMTEREVRRALLSQTAYQSCGRGILRDPDSTGVFLLIVPDRDTAEDIAGYYPGCRIEKLDSDIEEPKIGRPSKYASDVERDAAKKEQNRLSQRRVRRKSLYTGDSSDMGHSPDQIRHTLVHVLNEWAEATPTTTGIGAFARSNWISKSDRIGQGYTTSTPTGDLLAEMKRRQEVIRVCKEAASLMSPTIFDQPLQLPDHLMAIGITIKSSVRTKENALACRGFFLDIENSDMTPEDFAEAIPGLEFSACSSWSHTPDARRYRIAIPSTSAYPAGSSHADTAHYRRSSRSGWLGRSTGRRQEAWRGHWQAS